MTIAYRARLFGAAGFLAGLLLAIYHPESVALMVILVISTITFCAGQITIARITNRYSEALPPLIISVIVYLIHLHGLSFTFDFFSGVITALGVITAIRALIIVALQRRSARNRSPG